MQGDLKKMILTKIKVQVAHIDAFRHVNNARYLEYLAAGRWDFFEHVPAASEFLGSGGGLAVTSENIEYVKGATLGDVLAICTRITSPDGKAIVVDQTILDAKGRVILRCLANAVLFDTKAGKAVPVPDTLLDQMRKISGEADQSDSPQQSLGPPFETAAL